jgi:hypothetical protein
MKIAKYNRVPQEVVAAQYNGFEDAGFEDAEALAVWINSQKPAELVYEFPGMIKIWYGRLNEKVIVLAPGDWAVKLANGEYKRMSDEAFKALYTPKGN